MLTNPMLEHLADMQEKYKFSEYLFVSDSGSKAWGYDSTNSDNDVKFLYRRPTEFYKSMFEREDHVGPYKPTDMHDYTGWDVNKVLKLAYKGNAQVYELFKSPRLYYTTPEGVKLGDFCVAALNENLKSVAYHYYGLAYKTFKERVAEVGEQVTTKKYLYVLRPLFHVLEMGETQLLPTLAFDKLLSNVKHLLPEFVHDTTLELLNLKKSGNLGADVKGDHLDALDNWLDMSLSALKLNLKTETFIKEPTNKALTNRETFDRMFVELVFRD